MGADDHTDQIADSTDGATGRRGVLRTLGLGGLGALAGLSVLGEADARKQDRERRRQERAERRTAQAEKKKKKKKPAPVPAPLGISGAKSDFVKPTEGLPANQSWTDLDTVGPRVSVTVPAAGRVLVMLTGTFENAGNDTTSFMGFESTGGSGNISPDESRAIMFFVETADTATLTLSATIPVAGLSAGEHTFTAKYKSSPGGAVRFLNRYLTVIPLA
jgi:hypothetical protein